jgi:hypothetical protein
MIHKLRVNASAEKILSDLADKHSYRFTKIFNGELCSVSFRYVFFDDYGYEYNRYIYMRATKDDRHIIVYINKRDFPYYWNDVDDVVLNEIRRYFSEPYEEVY